MPEFTWSAAPAKINLALHVTGQRDDGFHLLETIAVFAEDAGDRIAVRSADLDSFSIEGPEAAALGSEYPDRNLVVRARDMARAVLADKGFAVPPVEIVLDKRLPAGSGIGGGSADAAATLKALAEHWNADSALPAIAEKAATLGADVPMCLVSRPLTASGIGETIRTVAEMPPLAMVLANPRRHVSTPAVFNALQHKNNAPLPGAGPEGPASAAGWAAWLKEHTRNDLQPPSVALTPEVGACLDALEATGPLLARMSGSGATCFAIHADMEAAQAAASDLLRAYPDWWITATQTGAAAQERQ